MKSLTLQHSDAAEESWSYCSASRRQGDPPDFCSRDGAAALKSKIEDYWRLRGQDVMLSLHNVGFHPAIRAARYDVRSDMVNGMPRGALKAAVKCGGNGQAAAAAIELEAESFEDADHWIDD